MPLAWRLRRAPVRLQLALLVLAAALPTFAAFVLYLVSAREEARFAAHQRVQLLVDDTAERVLLVLRSQERLMHQLAREPMVRALNSEQCDPLLREYGRLQPFYLTLLLRDMQGNPVCALSANAPPRERVVELAWFQDSLRSSGFFVGDVSFAPTARRWMSVTTVPVRAKDGEQRGVLILPVDLLALNEQVMRGLPASVMVTVADRQDRIVMRSEDAASWISRPTEPMAAAVATERGLATLTDGQGARRVVAYRSMPELGWRVVAEMPESAAFQAADVAMRRGLMVSLAMLLGVFLLTWRMARGIVGPLQVLARTADRVAGGDAQARVPPHIGSPEIASAAHAINLMLDADHRARQALLVSEERLATTLYSISEGVIATDAQGRVERMNPAAERLTGWSVEDARGMPLSMVLRLVEGDARTPVPDPSRRVLESGQAQASTAPRLSLSRDGAEYHVSDSAAPMRNAGGAVAGVVVVVSDVSRAYRLQKEVRENELRYRSLVEDSPVGILVHRDMKFVYVNPVAARMLGAASSQELVGRSFLVHVPQERHAAVVARVHDYLQRRRGVPAMEVRYLRLDGSGFDAEVQSSYLEYEGQPSIQVTMVDVTERTQAQRALRQSQENLAITLNSIGDAVVVTDMHGNITRMNPVAERLTGWPLEQAKGRPLAEVFRIVDVRTRAQVGDPVQRVLDTGEVVGLANHTALLARDGAEYQISDSAAPIRGADGTVMGVVLVFSDVSEQYRLQAAMRESELRYRSLVEHSPVGVYVHRLGDILYANPQAARLFGAPSVEALVGRSTLSLTPEDLRAHVQARMRDNLARREGENQRQTRFLRIDGTQMHVELYSAYVEFDGAPAMHASFVDVTERVRALDALRQSEENLAITLQSIGDAVLVTDAEGRITRMNPVAERLTAWTLEAARGRPLSEVFRIVNALTRAPAADPVQRVLETGQVVGLANHTALLARDGTEYQISDSAAPMRGADDRILGVVLVFSDVTEQYRLRRVLEESEQRYRGVVDSTPVGILVHREGRLFYANPMSLEILGARDQEELARHSVLDIVHPSYHGLLAQRARQADEGVVKMPMAEWQYVRLDGRVIDVLAQASVIQVHDGAAVQVSFMDITPRKLAERTLRENEARYRALTQLSSDWYWELDADFRLTRVDGNLHGLTGRDNDSFLGLARWGFIEAELSEEEWERHRAVLALHQEFRDLELHATDARGQVYWAAISGTPIVDDDGRFRGYRGIGRDITEQKVAADKIHALAFYDALTELPNRRLLVEQLKKALLTHVRSHSRAALLFIDLDNFKTLNDTQGHETGDMLLRQVARRLQACVREVDSVARLGGDEFVVMIEDLSTDALEATTQATLVAHKVLAAFSTPFVLDGREHRSTPSIGMTLVGDGARSVEDLLKQADLAMYQAKAAGRNTLRLFDQQMQAAVDSRAALEADLLRGIEAEQMVLYYQPVVLADGRVIGAEALVRWAHPTRGLVPPSEFIAVAEAARLIEQLGGWVLDAACAQLAHWGRGDNTRHLSLSVNVSAQQFTSVDFVARVLSTLERHGANPARLKLELTESLLAENVDEIVCKMRALREREVEFALDDFGTGYSSLSYLQRLPLTHLKIDQSFVRDVLTERNVASIARTIVSLGTHLGLQVVAEGVENEGQRSFLHNIGCTSFQGYLYGRPVPIAEFEAVHVASGGAA